jgi:hypothetical protein
VDAVDGLMLHVTVAPVAVNCCEPPAARLTVEGLTVIEGGVSIMDTE